MSTSLRVNKSANLDLIKSECFYNCEFLLAYMKFLHTRFRVSSMEKSVAFYTMILGFEIARKTTSPRGFPLVFLTYGASECELELVQLPGSFSVPEDLMHIAISVADISVFNSILTDGPHKTSSGNVIGFVADPDGYEIELIQQTSGK